MYEWKPHWVRANPAKPGENRIATKDGRAVYQKKINGEWKDQPPMKFSTLLASKGWGPWEGENQ